MTCSNGQTVTPDIGEVRVFGNLQNHELFKFHSGSSSSEHINQETMIATTPLTVQTINIPFEELSEKVDVKVNLDSKLIKEFESLNQSSRMNENWIVEWNDIKGISSHEGILFPFQLEQDDWLQLSMRLIPIIKIMLNLESKSSVQRMIVNHLSESHQSLTTLPSPKRLLTKS